MTKKQFISVGLTITTKEALDGLKLCKGESYDQLMRRILKIENEPKIS